MKRVIITGGNKGIGLELTLKFLELDYEVIVIARDFSNFEYKKHKNIKTIEFDMNGVEKIPQLVESIGQIDILINNAGVMYTLPYDNYSKEKQESMMNINLYAPIKMIEECAKYMKNGARIVNNASVAAHTGHPDIWYGITKAGILNATKSFAKIFENKIIVNAVAPGIIATEMQEVNSKERKEAFIKNSISKRAGYPDEVAQTMLWLATDAPEYINGTCIDINGGAYPR
jgi:3-oxoacyl-[acyl-carrier protein] reductase